jgi:polyisoprenoid-binding protein YceI
VVTLARRRGLSKPILILVGVLLVAVAVWWFLVRSDAPPAPDLATAIETAAAAQATTTVAPATTAMAATTTVTPATTAMAATTTAAPATTAPPVTTAPPATTVAPTADPSGTWIVDPDIGSFQDFTSSWVGYRIDEELGRGIGATTAVGRTPLVTGTVEVDNGVAASAEVTADLRGLKSDRTSRDGKVLEVLHVDQHPEAVFVMAEPVPLTTGATEMSATVPGTLTVNGVSVAVEATLEVTLVGDVLAVVGSLPVVLADHDVVAPSASIVISVADSGVVEFQLFLTRAVGGTG